MGPLLVVLVVGCAVAVAAHVGRGLWARARTVERHHQALESLADITQGPDGAPRGRADDPTGAHQAHVRIIGATTVPEGPALPPPRPVVGAAKGRTSPFRRPSRHSPSLAALDAVATARTLRAPLHGPSRQRGGRPETPEAAPSVSGGNDDRTLPGVLPPAVPGPATAPATRPAPVAGPQVFYFDDLGARRARSDVPAQAVPGKTTTGAMRPPGEAVGQAVWPSATVFDDTAPAQSPPAQTRPAQSPPAPPPGQPARDGLPGHGGLGRKAVVASLLAAAAIVVALAVVALTIFGAGPGAKARQAGPPVAPPHARTSAVVTVPRSSPTSTAPPTSVTATTGTTRPALRRPAPTRPAPSRPAALVSAASGTATYHLVSRSASIVVSAKGACWLEVRAGSPSGQVIYEGTLEAGQRSSITGPAWIRIGDPPKVTVLVNGMRLGPPGAEEAVPLNLQFTVAATD